jgi:uncharacterized protein
VNKDVVVSGHLPSASFLSFPSVGIPNHLLSRRHFLSAATLAGASALTMNSSGVEETVGPSPLVDVNINLSRWPARRLRGDETATLVARLRHAGVAQAWAGSFDGLFHKDIAAVNERLADECRRHDRELLVPFGSINPTLPDWEDELRRCHQGYGMPGIRLHPNYHGYQLDDPVFARLLELVASQRMIVQLAVKMEDERTMHPLLRVDPVELAPLAALVRQIPGLRLVLLNALGVLRGEALTDLVAAGDVHVEISMLEGVGGVGKLLEQIPRERILFGSHAPFFYFESALLKLDESPLGDTERDAVRSGNAGRLINSLAR